MVTHYITRLQDDCNMQSCSVFAVQNHDVSQYHDRDARPSGEV